MAYEEFQPSVLNSPPMDPPFLPAHDQQATKKSLLSTFTILCLSSSLVPEVQLAILHFSLLIRDLFDY